MSSPSYQDKLIFPAPEISYTVETSQGQVLYLPRDAMQRAERRKSLGYPSNKLLYSMVQKQKLEEVEKLQKLKLSEQKKLQKRKLLEQKKLKQTLARLRQMLPTNTSWSSRIL